MKDFIAWEIKRLRYYGLDGLITSPPGVEIMWPLPPPPPPPPTPEEIAQREWRLANPTQGDLFTEGEMAALFAEPDYESIKGLHARGMAYDWHLKFTEAERCFREDDSLMSKFMLGRYYKQGRVGIPANRWKANGMFREIILRVTEESKEPTPEELCLAARACKEMTPMIPGATWDERLAFEKQAKALFEAAAKQGCKKAVFYPRYYYENMRCPGNLNPDALRKAMAPEEDIEAMVLAAGKAQLDNNGKGFYPQKAENMAILKRGIQEHVSLAEYFVGALFSKQRDNNGVSALKGNPERAKFWLLRAAKRGDDWAALQVEFRKGDGNLYHAFTDEELGLAEEQT